jgi:hypothetical protein
VAGEVREVFVRSAERTGISPVTHMYAHSLSTSGHTAKVGPFQLPWDQQLRTPLQLQEEGWAEGAGVSAGGCEVASSSGISSPRSH